MALQDSKCLGDLFEKGKAANKEKKFEEAKNIYESILENDPSCIEAWNNLGVTLCEIDQYRRALDAYNEIKVNNRTAKTWYNISLAHYYLRDFGQALNCINKALELDFHDSASLDLRGKIQVEQEDYQSAMESFILAFSTDGEPKFLLWDAYSLYLHLEFSGGIDERTQRKLLHMLIRRLERLEEITHSYHRRKALTSSDSNSDCDICQQSLYYLGCAYSRYKDYSTAMDRLEQCIQENPNSRVAHSARKLLQQNWSQVRSSPWKWWLQSSPHLNRRMKRFIAIFVLALLIFIIILFLLHPLFGLKDEVEWSIYLFVASLLLILLLSPGVEQITAKDIEIKMHASSPFDPFPSPAKMEDDIGTMSRRGDEIN